MAAFRTETEFIHWLRGRAPNRTRGLKLGIGDDAALASVRIGQELILTTDLSIEGVHFTRALHPPRSVGHRALARSLSDIAAMGGTPRFALVSLALSKLAARAWVRDLYSGMFEFAKRFGVAVVGGDTAVVPGSAVIDVTVAGEALSGRALRRSGAQPGDQLFVSGTLGLSALGLRLLKARRSHSDRRARQAIQAHLYPEPQCALGRFLSGERLASSAIDLSDGLSTDLAHLCEASGVGARVWLDRIPAPEVSSPQRSPRASELELALHGGEDYQLLFTVPRRKARQVPPRFRGVSLHRIGEIQSAKKLVLVDANGHQAPLEPCGYDHFRRS